MRRSPIGSPGSAVDASLARQRRFLRKTCRRVWQEAPEEDSEDSEEEVGGRRLSLPSLHMNAYDLLAYNTLKKKNLLYPFFTI